MRKVIALTALLLSAYIVVAASGIDKSSKPDGSIEKSQNPDHEPGAIVVKFRSHAGDLKGIEAVSRTGIPCFCISHGVYSVLSGLFPKPRSAVEATFVNTCVFNWSCVFWAFVSETPSV